MHSEIKYLVPSLLGMTPIEIMGYVSSPSFLGYGTLKRFLEDRGSKLLRNLQLTGVSVSTQLSAPETVALLLTREFTERNVSFLRRYLENFLQLKLYDVLAGIFYNLCLQYICLKPPPTNGLRLRQEDLCYQLKMPEMLCVHE